MASTLEWERHGFTFLWRIKNFSFCNQLKDKYLESPKYIVHSLGNSEWYLRLYPRGRIFDCYIPCFLRRSDSADGPENIAVDYNLSIISVDDSSKFRQEINEHSFNKGSGFGFPDFLKRDVIFSNPATYLPKDTLTVRCQMRKHRAEFATFTTCNATTRIAVESRYFTWSIKDFTSRNWSHKLKVPVMTASKMLSDLNLYFFTTASDDYLQITIENTNAKDDEAVVLKCRIAVLDFNGLTRASKTDDYMFQNYLEEWEFPPFILKNKLTRSSDVYLPNDVLTLRCHFSISSGIESERIEEFIYGPFDASHNQNPATDFKSVYHRDQHSLRNDLHRLYIKQQLCDLTLRTESVYILVHKAVVCARSSVLSDLIENDPKVRHTGIVDIPDVDPDTLRRLLTFMYTDILEDIASENAMKLYLIAVRYQIYSLKDLCLRAICVNLSTGNICDVLLFAEKRNDVVLKTASLEFILENAVEVFKSDKWKHFMVKQVQMAGEIMHQVQTPVVPGHWRENSARRDNGAWRDNSARRDNGAWRDNSARRDNSTTRDNSARRDNGTRRE
ncbi:speckle-type POZ protein [Trichonephila clavata]|uniref:Speckle-type POZ protein n=1 Tax=Trichonephila clavata TaxID=2740835 RepID=A0A8X6HYP7_TRICU|nr:speckle-type POZ protein [Trichonephila clavata]